MWRYYFLPRCLQPTTPQANPSDSVDLLDLVARRKLALSSPYGAEMAPFPHPSRVSPIRLRALGLAVRVDLLAERDPQLVETRSICSALSVSAPGAYRSPEIEAARRIVNRRDPVARNSAPHRDRAHRLADSTRELINHGATIALGSGLNPESGSTASMQSVVQMGCEVLGLSLAEAISAATVNAAWALGVGGGPGTLERGKLGDLILLNTSDYRDISLVTGPTSCIRP